MKKRYEVILKIALDGVIDDHWLMHKGYDLDEMVAYARKNEERIINDVKESLNDNMVVSVSIIIRNDINGELLGEVDWKCPNKED